MQLVGWSCDWRNSQHACFTSINWSMLAAGNRIWVWKKNEYSNRNYRVNNFCSILLIILLPDVLPSEYFLFERELMWSWPRRDNGVLAVKLSSFSRDAGLNSRISAYFICNVDCRTLACTKLNLSIYWGITLPDKPHPHAFGHVDEAVSGGKPHAGKGVVGLFSWHGLNFWVCITFCKVHHGDSVTKPDYYYHYYYYY